MIRVAKPGDTEQLVKIGRKIVNDKLEYLSPDDSRTRQLLENCISSAQHLVLVSEDDRGTIKGGIVVLTQPFAYAAKLHSQIIALYTNIKGDGVLLINHTLKWFETRKASLLLCYAAPVESQLDQLLIAKRFKREGTMLVRRRYNGISKQNSQRR